MMSSRARYIKAELVRRGKKLTEIAAEAGVDKSFVSHVIAGRRGSTRRESAVAVMDIIARELSMPREELFPATPEPAAA